MNVNINPTRAEAGKTITPHITILPAVFHLTLLKFLAAPPPIIAVDFIVPVDTGKPKNVASNNPIDAAISVAKA